jgi:sirohydrochlorin ferrochelatase
VKRALLVVDHGSREPEAAAHLERIAGELRKHRPDLAVYTAHLELAEPSIGAAVAACARDGIEELFVHPFFLAPGRHATRDLPAAVEAAARAHPGLRVRLTEPAGAAAGMAELILATLPPVTE